MTRPFRRFASRAAVRIMSNPEITKEEGLEPRRGRRSGGRRSAHFIFVIFSGLILLLPHRWAVAVGPWLGRLAYALDSRHRRVVHENLALALPELDERPRRRIARACFSHFGFALLDFVSSSRLAAQAYLERCEVEGLAHLERAENAGRGVLLLTAHFGCWEAIANWLALSGYKVKVIFRPLDNHYLDRDLKRLRERFGNESIPKRSAARAALKALRGKGRVGILVDQRVHPNAGDALLFFGREAYTSPLPAQLSLRTGSPVLPVFAVPVGSKGYKISIREPIWPEEVAGSESPEKALSLRYLEVTESEIRSAPELWLWMHRRWRVNPITSLRGRGLRREASSGQERGASSSQEREAPPNPDRQSPPSRESPVS